MNVIGSIQLEISSVKRAFRVHFFSFVFSASIGGQVLPMGIRTVYAPQPAEQVSSLLNNYIEWGDSFSLLSFCYMLLLFHPLSTCSLFDREKIS